MKVRSAFPSVGSHADPRGGPQSCLKRARCVMRHLTARPVPIPSTRVASAFVATCNPAEVFSSSFFPGAQPRFLVPAPIWLPLAPPGALQVPPISTTMATWSPLPQATFSSVSGWAPSCWLKLSPAASPHGALSHQRDADSLLIIYSFLTSSAQVKGNFPFWVSLFPIFPCYSNEDLPSPWLG